MIVADNLEKIEMRGDRIEEMDERAGENYKSLASVCGISGSTVLYYTYTGPLREQRGPGGKEARKKKFN